MLIKCSSHPYKKDVFTLFINEEPWKEIHTSIFGKTPQLDALIEPLDIKFQELELRLSKNFALRRLVQRNFSSYEMEKLLYERFVSKETVHKIVKELVDSGYINDQDWIAGFIRRNIEKKQGFKNIAMKLRAKGVPEHEIESKLSDFEEEDLQSVCIKKLLETKYRSRDFSDYREKQKVIASLIRRGFGYEDIHATITNVQNN